MQIGKKEYLGKLALSYVKGYWDGIEEERRRQLKMPQRAILLEEIKRQGALAGISKGR